MHLVVLVVLGVLACIGTLTLFAVAAVLRFGDESLGALQGW